jgi:mRNA interferase MazF
MTDLPSRGEIWLADLNPVLGHERSGTRPCLVVSTNGFNHGPAELVMVLPLTTKDRRIPLHVPLERTESGLNARSFIKCEDIRSVSRVRLINRVGAVGAPVLDAVSDRLRILLEL